MVVKFFVFIKLRDLFVEIGKYGLLVVFSLLFVFVKEVLLEIYVCSLRMDDSCFCVIGGSIE